MTTADTLDRTWLVQRLRKPLGRHPIFGADNPFAFGGGMQNGGLSNEAMDLLRPIFSFDYMGSAEFEFGAVPKALNVLAKNARGLAAFSFAIPLADVAAHWHERNSAPPKGSAQVYVLCQSKLASEVEARVRELAAKEYQLKEATRFPSALRPVDDFDTETIGWLELNNGFVFFIDRDAWARTSALFGVDVEQVTA